ncbi:MAG: hypothetical protein LBG74_07620 [Spirochaetaceae bacterium]|jgi:hypothetical protein|nr:hypothetical protein [Spirochaetaceae bacterium]
MTFVLRTACCACVLFALNGAVLEAVPAANAPEDDATPAVAEKYLEWAAKTVASGDYAKALLFLERAQDFASELSDLSYLLAIARHKTDESAFEVLGALRTALETDHWTRWNSEDARLLAAEIEIRLRDYNGALRDLKHCTENQKTALLRISALQGAAKTDQYAQTAFRRELIQANRRYQSNPDFARIAFLWAEKTKPDDRHDGANGKPRKDTSVDTDFIAGLLKRLPALLEKDSSLAYMAAPFFTGADEARNTLLTWYAEKNGDVTVAAVPALLTYGVIDEKRALEHLAREYSLDAALIRTVYSLFRTDDSRAAFNEIINAYTGVISEDYDGDGFAEALAVYQNGQLQTFTLDTTQDGLADVTMTMNDGVPAIVWQPFFPANTQGAPAETAGRFFVERNSGASISNREKLVIYYSTYPAIEEIHASNLIYRFPPNSFFHKPVEFEQFAGPFGLPFPVMLDKKNINMTLQSLWAEACEIETRGRNFEESILLIELNGGQILSAQELVNGKMAVQDFFSGGRLYERHIDIDLDGNLETRLRFPGLSFDTPEDYLNFTAAESYVG